jgi:hypothetical protein
MRKEAQDHHAKSLAEINNIFSKVVDKLENVPRGQTISATNLSKELGEPYGKTAQQLYPVLQFIFNNYPGFKMKKGPHGGLYRLTEEEEEKEITTI